MGKETFIQGLKYFTVIHVVSLKQVASLLLIQNKKNLISLKNILL